MSTAAVPRTNGGRLTNPAFYETIFIFPQF